MTSSVLAQVAALPGKPTAALREMWAELYGTEAPSYNKTFLVKRLAYRLQELAYGGLSEEARVRLNALADEGVDPKAPRKRHDDRPITGTRLVREWKGVEHHVTVRDDCFEYQGRPYRSLSAVARTITGTQWNGRTFFGLKRPGPAK